MAPSGAAFGLSLAVRVVLRVLFGWILDMFELFSEAPRRLGVLLCFIWNSLGGVACQNTGALDPKAYGSLQGCLRKRCWRLSSYTSVFFSFVAFGVVQGFRCLAGQAFFGHIMSWYTFGHIIAIICENECDKL